MIQQVVLTKNAENTGAGLRRHRLLPFREFVAQLYEPEKSAKLNERACQRKTPDTAQQQLVETLVRAVRMGGVKTNV